MTPKTRACKSCMYTRKPCRGCIGCESHSASCQHPGFADGVAGFEAAGGSRPNLRASRHPPVPCARYRRSSASQSAERVDAFSGRTFGNLPEVFCGELHPLYCYTTLSPRRNDQEEWLIQMTTKKSRRRHRQTASLMRALSIASGCKVRWRRPSSLVFNVELPSRGRHRNTSGRGHKPRRTIEEQLDASIAGEVAPGWTAWLSRSSAESGRGSRRPKGCGLPFGLEAAPMDGL